MLEQKLKAIIRDVPNFPKEGIIFKDITPILSYPEVCNAIVEDLVLNAKKLEVEVIAGIEARGFLFGPLIAQKMGIPFVPLRKSGKLPYKSYKVDYNLEYGTASLEMHEDAFTKNARVLIHDDLLATGGTALAAAALVQNIGQVVGYSFLIDLEFLSGKQLLSSVTGSIYSIVKY